MDPNPRSREPFWQGVLTLVLTCRSSGWAVMKCSKVKDRNGPPLSVTIVRTGVISPVAGSTGASSMRGGPSGWAASVRAFSMAVTASWRMEVGEMWASNSYLDQ